MKKPLMYLLMLWFFFSLFFRNDNTFSLTSQVSDNSITLSAPSTVTIWTTFTYSWTAKGWYEYCEYGPFNNIWSTLPLPWPQKVWLIGSVNVMAQTVYTSEPMTVWITCYYKGDDSSSYKYDTKTQTIWLSNSTCTKSNTPICWIVYKNMCSDDWLWGIVCKDYPDYMTFSNKCELEKNTDWYNLYKDWKCEKDDRYIKVSAPSEIKRWDKFTMSRDASSRYNICVYMWSTINTAEWQTWYPDNLLKNKWSVVFDSTDINDSVFKVKVLCNNTDDIFTKEESSNIVEINILDEEENKAIQLTNNIKLKLDKSIKKILEKIDLIYKNKADKIIYINKIIDKLVIVESNKPKYRNITQYLINEFNEELLKINTEEDINIDEIINIIE